MRGDAVDEHLVVGTEALHFVSVCSDTFCSKPFEYVHHVNRRHQPFNISIPQSLSDAEGHAYPL
jgi:hypothetical protein